MLDGPHKEEKMKVALPIMGGKLSPHFGQCEGFALFEVDETAKDVSLLETMTSPGHARGFLPGWLADKGVDVVIANGMGGRAMELLAERGVKVFTTASDETPEDIVRAYVAGSLEAIDFTCEGGHGHG